MGWDAKGLAQTESTAAVVQVVIRAVDRGGAAQANGVGGTAAKPSVDPGVWGSATRRGCFSVHVARKGAPDSWGMEGRTGRLVW